MTLGIVLNKDDVLDIVEGPVAASTNLTIGFVYEDGANGWKVAPVDGSITADALYWNPTAKDNSSGSKGDLTCTVYGEGARVVGQADGVIVVDAPIRASNTAAHGGQVKALAAVVDAALNGTFDDAEAEAALDALRDYHLHKIGTYKGHYLTEIGNVDISRTNAADTETNCVFELRRG